MHLYLSFKIHKIKYHPKNNNEYFSKIRRITHILSCVIVNNLVSASSEIQTESNPASGLRRISNIQERTNICGDSVQNTLIVLHDRGCALYISWHNCPHTGQICNFSPIFLFFHHFAPSHEMNRYNMLLEGNARVSN